MRRFISASYAEEHDFVMDEIEIVCQDFIPYSDFKEAVADILNALTDCDTYCISEDFEMCGNYGGYLRLYNVNKDRTYYLFGQDVEEFMNVGYVCINCEDADDTDRNDFEARY